MTTSARFRIDASTHELLLDPRRHRAQLAPKDATLPEPVFPQHPELLHDLIVRTDGTLAPCFPMYAATYDWGTLDNPKLNPGQLRERKKTCQQQCFSTLNHNLAYCYNDARVIKWIWSQLRNGFQGGARSFGD